MRGECQAFNNYNKKIIKKLTNSDATFPLPQSDGITAGRGCNVSELKNKNKTRNKPTPRATHTVNDFPYVTGTSSQMSTTC
jgi:hypothetical protein